MTYFVNQKVQKSMRETREIWALQNRNAERKTILENLKEQKYQLTMDLELTFGLKRKQIKSLKKQIALVEKKIEAFA